MYTKAAKLSTLLIGTVGKYGSKAVSFSITFFFLQVKQSGHLMFNPYNFKNHENKNKSKA